MNTKTSRRIPDFIWRWMRPFNQRVSRSYLGGFRGKKFVMLLTTTGRLSGQPRVTPLQFEELDGLYYVGSARGADADWFKNIVANPEVTVQLQEHRFQAIAEPVTDPARIADFFELRLERLPRMMGRLMRLEGLPPNHTRADMIAFASEKAMVVIHPCGPVQTTNREDIEEP